MALYVLFESASGYSLFNAEGFDDFQRANEAANKSIGYDSHRRSVDPRDLDELLCCRL